MDTLALNPTARDDAPSRWNWKLLLLAAAGAALIALPLAVDSPSYQNILILVLMAAQLGVAWNILGGYAGQVSLGHAAFFGIGAYTSTILLVQFGLNPWLGALAGGGCAVLASLVIGWPCFRLKGHYFTMATIAVGEIIQTLFNNWDLAGAAVGLTIPMDKQGWGTLVFASKTPYYYLALGLLAISLAVNWWVERSRLGYYFRAIKDEPDAARSLGVSLTRYKLVALALSSFLAALGGSLYAQKELYIDPGSVLHTGLSIKMALVGILGGVGSLFGPVVGAAALTVIEEGSRMSFGGTGRGTDLIVYATIIIAIAVYKPSGLAGWAQDIAAAWRARRTAKGEQA
ncbi:MAG TPA: branched-chain amino acid ABC transporter permease [Albitalea sp.]|nr:branched-chain amino acid ABC transporter permease [Albitalea sp.]